MKKVNKKLPAPAGLQQYLGNNPLDTWKQFCDNDRDSYEAVQSELRSNQRGICAYCEIRLSEFKGVGLDDFRVEHFHPKSRPPHPPPNWGLDWCNLLAVCTGGNARHIGNSALFTTPDHSCDVPKADKNLVGTILDVLNDIPAFPPIFMFNELGEMDVDGQCPANLHGKARASIEELRLSPSASKDIPVPRLIRFRKALIDKLRAQLMERQASGLSLQAASAELAEVYFTNEQTSEWPSFFSTIRWYLGPMAEARLQAIGYDG